MAINYGDHLIDSGYYDPTPEQEREIVDADMTDTDNLAGLVEREERSLLKVYHSGKVNGDADIRASFERLRAGISARVAELEGQLGDMEMTAMWRNEIIKNRDAVIADSEAQVARLREALRRIAYHDYTESDEDTLCDEPTMIWQAVAMRALSDAPGHTDLMVTPESLDAFMEANPLPDAALTAGEELTAAEMRERAAKVSDTYWKTNGNYISRAIRALPIKNGEG